MKNVVVNGSTQKQMNSHIFGAISQTSSRSCCLYVTTGYGKVKYATISGSKMKSCSSIVGFQASRGSSGSNILKENRNCNSLSLKRTVNPRCCHKTQIDISLKSQNMNFRLLVPKQAKVPNIKCNMGPVSWKQSRSTAGLIIGLLVCYSTIEPVHAEASNPDDGNENHSGSSSTRYSHGKRVISDYSVTGISGDGRCLFRSVAHGACLRSGKLAPNETLQRELADELRARVADEFIKRRTETEWFIEGDFDAYVAKMRKPHVWGGEPELLMASHVLQMPITVYMYDRDSGGLISIAEYGQEYGRDNPIKILYHGFGHYDALRIPEQKGARSRL